MNGKTTSGPKITYLDNNSTTIMPQEVIDTMCKWTNMGNPSSDYCSAMSCRKLIAAFREYIAKLCDFKLATGEDEASSIDDSSYRIVFTSGASESNALIIRSTVDAYLFNVGVLPHIVSSEIEHNSILELLKQLENEKKINLTLVAPNRLGFISALDVQAALLPNTALCTIMYANNETGVINDIPKIAELCHKNNTPFHTDAVQIFGKNVIRPIKESIDAFSVSFHKLHCPVGVGMLVIKEEFLRGYKLKSQISGTQNANFRGGTINITGIAGCFSGLKYTMENRLKKNEHLKKLKIHTIKEMSKHVPCRMYSEYLADAMKNTPKPSIEIVFISSPEDIYLPNTLMLSVVKRTKPEFCNVELKKYLCALGIIVSIGSACNTDSDKASHVIKAMNVDVFIRKGVLRVSFGDESTTDECNIFIKKMIEYIAKLS